MIIAVCRIWADNKKERRQGQWEIFCIRKRFCEKDFKPMTPVFCIMDTKVTAKKPPLSDFFGGGF